MQYLRDFTFVLSVHGEFLYLACYKAKSSLNCLMPFVVVRKSTRSSTRLSEQCLNCCLQRTFQSCLHLLLISFLSYKYGMSTVYLQQLHSSPHTYSYVGWTNEAERDGRGMQHVPREKRKPYRGLMGNTKEINHLEVLGVNGRLILTL